MSHTQEIFYADRDEVIRAANAWAQTDSPVADVESAADLAEEEGAIELLRKEVEADAERVEESEAALANFINLTPIQVRAIAASLS